LIKWRTEDQTHKHKEHY